jgi:hypothetical protein
MKLILFSLVSFFFLVASNESEAQVKRFPLEKLCGQWRAKGTVILEECKDFAVPVYYDTLLQEYCIKIEDNGNSCGGMNMRCYLFYNESKKCYEALTISGNKTYRMQGAVRDGFLIFKLNEQEGILEMVIGIDVNKKTWNMDIHLIDPKVGFIPMTNLQFEAVVGK